MNREQLKAHVILAIKAGATTKAAIEHAVHASKALVDSAIRSLERAGVIAQFEAPARKPKPKAKRRAKRQAAAKRRAPKRNPQKPKLARTRPPKRKPKATRARRARKRNPVVREEVVAVRESRVTVTARKARKRAK